MTALRLLSLILFGLVASAGASPSNTVARIWNEENLSAIRIDTPHPPAQARNLFSLSVCMYDAWAAYDITGAVGYVYHGKHSATNSAAARHEAISYAAYRLLKERYAYSKSASTTLAALDARMASIGYDTNNSALDPNTPAGVGNSVYAAVSAWFMNDGARQTNGTPDAPYPDYPAGQGGYVYTNPPLVTGVAGVIISNVNLWQRLVITNAYDQNGFPTGPVQKYLGAQWLGGRPFALVRTNSALPWLDPGPPPFLGAVSDAEFRSNVVAVIRRASELTPDDGVSMDISPGAFGNNSLGANDGNGHPLNPATGLPYAPNVVRRGDFARVLAEFWADGPNSETPPGHWNTLANAVSDNPSFAKHLGGTGPVLDALEWDVKLYLALNAALHDAACAAWSLKRYYDGWRPISAVRYMGQCGQGSDPFGPAYHPDGLPLVPGLIEVVNPLMAFTNTDLALGRIAIRVWPGQPADPTNQYSGVKWIHADTWLPYQKASFVTPAFPGYVSGHSTFSRSAAEVLAAITGSPFFPGGMGTYTAVSNTSLSFENGPSQTVQLQWGTYYDAADQAGLSRLWGGIHPPVDDFTGRRVGSQCGQAAWALAQEYFDGSVTNLPVTLALQTLNSNQLELRFNTVRGLYYQMQSAPDLGQAFTNEPGGFALAFDTVNVQTNVAEGLSKFYRVRKALTP
jgi:hypothetical protein